MADGRWQMADGRWQMADGRWRCGVSVGCWILVQYPRVSAKSAVEQFPHSARRQCQSRGSKKRPRITRIYADREVDPANHEVLIRDLSTMICHLPSAICHLPSAIQHPASRVYS